MYLGIIRTYSTKLVRLSYKWIYKNSAFASKEAILTPQMIIELTEDIYETFLLSNPLQQDVKVLSLQLLME